MDCAAIALSVQVMVTVSSVARLNWVTVAPDWPWKHSIFPDRNAPARVPVNRPELVLTHTIAALSVFFSTVTAGAESVTFVTIVLFVQVVGVVPVAMKFTLADTKPTLPKLSVESTVAIT